MADVESFTCAGLGTVAHTSAVKYVNKKKYVNKIAAKEYIYSFKVENPTPCKGKTIAILHNFARCKTSYPK